ncbi:MAG TPA: ATP-binding protein [Chthoniobacteraceae bacterium]|nr:ATP-binding protein [Chthoniobacteraceae bacterium]
MDSHEPPERPRLPPTGWNGTDDLRILVLAPLANDAKLTAGFLTAAGLQAVACADAADTRRRAEESCGSLLVAEEAIDDEFVRLWREFSDREPSWSELPIGVVINGGAAEPGRRRITDAFGRFANIILLERPFHPSTMISMLESALRSRQRQYQVRDLIHRDRKSAEHLEFVLRAGGLGAWRLDLRTLEMACTETCKANFGLPTDSELTYQRVEQLINPEDREQWKQAIQGSLASRQEFNSEYRITTPDGELRWIQVKGTAAYDEGGNPIHLSGITQNVTKRKRAEEAIDRQATALREADRRKDEFLAMLAHELRNPLSAIGNAAAVLKDHIDGMQSGGDPDSPNVQTWAAMVIERQNRQLARLVDDLLDVSRITRGKIELRREVIDAAVCLRNACEAVAPMMSDRGHSLECSFPDNVLWINADPTRIEQIAVNLLVNAARYTESSGNIDLSASSEEIDGRPSVIIKVRDTGIGIAPDQIGAMFELFAQGERSTDRKEGGLGIGLTLVRALCEMHGGSVWATSEGRGRGSTFTVRLPGVPTPAPANLQKHGRLQDSEGGGRRILIVDDNVDTATGLSRLLARRGYTLRLAHDGYSAIQVAREFQPGTVLLDIGLPGMDGYEVARRLREEPGCGGALIVALSGYGQAEDRRRSYEAGFDHHLIKPVDFEEVRSLLTDGRVPARWPR